MTDPKELAEKAYENRERPTTFESAFLAGWNAAVEECAKLISLQSESPHWSNQIRALRTKDQ